MASKGIGLLTLLALLMWGPAWLRIFIAVALPVCFVGEMVLTRRRGRDAQVNDTPIK